MKKSTEQGYALVWMLMIIAFCALPMGALALGDDDGSRDIGIWIVGVSVCVFFLGMIVEARRDLYEFCGGLAVFSAITSVVTFVFAALAEAGALAFSVALLTGLVSVGCGYYRYRMQRSPEPLRNYVREQAGDDAIHELDGIQFVVISTDSNIRAGESFEVQIIAQNGWDVERILQVRLTRERRISLNFAGLVFEKDTEMILPGGAAGAIMIPVRAEWRAKGRYPFAVSVQTRGRGGTRLRRWRAKVMPSQVPALLTFVGAFVGIVVWGGGMKFQAIVQNSGDHESGHVPVEPASVSLLWRPTQDELREMAKA